MQHLILTCLRGEIFCHVCTRVCMFAADRNVLGEVIERYDLKRRLKCWKTHENVMRRSKAIFSHVPVLNLWNCFRAYNIDLRAKAKLVAWGTERRSWKHQDCPVHIRHQLLRLHGVKSSNKGLQDGPTEAATGLAPYWRQGGRAGWSSHLELEISEHVEKHQITFVKLTVTLINEFSNGESRSF